MNHPTNRKPDPRLKAMKVYTGEEERAIIESHAHAIDSTCSEFLRRAGLKAIAEYRAEQAAAAQVQIIHFPFRKEGPIAGRVRSLSLPGYGVRRAGRAFRPMRS